MLRVRELENVLIGAAALPHPSPSPQGPAVPKQQYCLIQGGISVVQAWEVEQLCLTVMSIIHLLLSRGAQILHP